MAPWFVAWIASSSPNRAGRHGRRLQAHIGYSALIGIPTDRVAAGTSSGVGLPAHDAEKGTNSSPDDAAGSAVARCDTYVPIPPGAANHSWSTWNATLTGPTLPHRRSRPPPRFPQGAARRPDGRGMRGSRRQVESVARIKREIAVVGVEHDRAFEAEQDLRAPVLVASESIAGTVGPRSRFRAALTLEHRDRLLAADRTRRLGRGHRASREPCGPRPFCGRPTTASPDVAPAVHRRNALARELHPLSVPGLAREPPYLEGAVTGRFDPALEHPWRRLRVLRDEIALERHQHGAFLLEGQA